MSRLDTELESLRRKLAAMEEQKRLEMEVASAKRAAPLKTLEEFVDRTKQRVEANRYSKSFPMARCYDNEKAAFLEPILLILKNIQERLEALEAKSDSS